MGRREMREVARFWASPGHSNELMYAYVARNLEPGRLTPDDDENIETELLPLAASTMRSAPAKSATPSPSPAFSWPPAFNVYLYVLARGETVRSWSPSPFVVSLSNHLALYGLPLIIPRFDERSKRRRRENERRMTANGRRISFARMANQLGEFRGGFPP